jgi:hypothetical protein
MDHLAADITGAAGDEDRHRCDLLLAFPISTYKAVFGRIAVRSQNRRGKSLANRGEDLVRRNVTHAAVMNHPANRLMARPAFDFGFALNRCRKWI